MKFPSDSPDWLVKSMTNLEEKASLLVRGHPDANRAAGYFQAVAELSETFTQEAELEESKRRKTFMSVVHGEPAG